MKPGDNHADFEFFRYRPTAADRDGWYHRQQQSQQARATNSK